MAKEYSPPEVEKDGFHCPNCGTFAHQLWEGLYSKNTSSGGGRSNILDGKISTCTRCRKPAIWTGETMIYPEGSSAPQPHEDMPENVKADFTEARKLIDDSPRSASALLRLAMEKLTKELTGEDDGLYENIGHLVEQEHFGPRVQQALDSIRVTGNDMLHAGQIYESDDRETALRLFKLVNTVVRLTITEEKLINDAYSEIPESKLEAIERRDQG